jgi:hypothetical protein
VETAAVEADIKAAVEADIKAAVEADIKAAVEAAKPIAGFLTLLDL